MFRLLAKATLALCVLLLAAVFAARPAFAQEAAPEPIRVMILASYHMNNPDRDVHNAASIRSPRPTSRPSWRRCRGPWPGSSRRSSPSSGSRPMPSI